MTRDSLRTLPEGASLEIVMFGGRVVHGNSLPPRPEKPGRIRVLKPPHGHSTSRDTVEIPRSNVRAAFSPEPIPGRTTPYDPSKIPADHPSRGQLILGILAIALLVGALWLES